MRRRLLLKTGIDTPIAGAAVTSATKVAVVGPTALTLGNSTVPKTVPGGVECTFKFANDVALRRSRSSRVTVTARSSAVRWHQERRRHRTVISGNSRPPWATPTRWWWSSDTPRRRGVKSPSGKAAIASLICHRQNDS